MAQQLLEQLNTIVCSLRPPPEYRLALEAAGLAYLSYNFAYKPAVSLLDFLGKQICFGCTAKRILSPDEGDFAVITGATDGIGLEYARQLAEKGFNLLLLSRSEEKLARVSGEILKQFSQCKKVEYLAVDFSRTDIYESIQSKLDSLGGPIRVLVNNVGTVNTLPNYFTAFAEGFNLNLININIVSMTLMSEIVLKRMLKQELPAKRPRGVIINISSGLGRSPFPFYSTYSASKVYINYLSKILATEYSADGILVQTISPNLVKTNLTKDLFPGTDPAQPNPGVDPKEFVQYALASVGVEQETSPHPRHKRENAMSDAMEWLVGDRCFMALKYSIMRKRAMEKNISAKKIQ